MTGPDLKLPGIETIPRCGEWSFPDAEFTDGPDLRISPPTRGKTTTELACKHRSSRGTEANAVLQILLPQNTREYLHARILPQRHMGMRAFRNG
jgi:hypothetical protein